MFLLPLTPVQHQTVPLCCNGGGGGGGSCSGGTKRTTQRRCARGAFALQSPPFSVPRSRGTSSSAAVPSGVQKEPAPVQRRVGLDSHRIGTVALAVSGGSRNSVLACCVAPASASRSPGTEHILFVERARMGCGRGKGTIFVPCNVHLAATKIRAAGGPAGPGGAQTTRATPTSPARVSGFTSCLHNASSFSSRCRSIFSF